MFLNWYELSKLIEEGENIIYIDSDFLYSFRVSIVWCLNSFHPNGSRRYDICDVALKYYNDVVRYCDGFTEQDAYIFDNLFERVARKVPLKLQYSQSSLNTLITYRKVKAKFVPARWRVYEFKNYSCPRPRFIEAIPAVPAHGKIINAAHPFAKLLLKHEDLIKQEATLRSSLIHLFNILSPRYILDSFPKILEIQQGILLEFQKRGLIDDISEYQFKESDLVALLLY